MSREECSRVTTFPVRNTIIQRFLTSMQREHWWTTEGPTAMAVQLVCEGGALTAKDQTIIGVCFALYNGMGVTRVADVLTEFTEREVGIVAGAMVAVMQGDASWWPASTPVQKRGLRIRALKIADPKRWAEEVLAARRGLSEADAAKSLGVSVKLFSRWIVELRGRW